jgi:DNA-directed RNA polymerase sigma subunit (sigma70/sigma32)
MTKDAIFAKTTIETARKFGVTKQRISQICRQFLTKL